MGAATASPATLSVRALAALDRMTAFAAIPRHRSQRCKQPVSDYLFQCDARTLLQHYLPGNRRTIGLRLRVRQQQPASNGRP